jgi:hypothetical protein
MGRTYEASVVPLRWYPWRRTRGHEMTEAESRRTTARSRAVRWIESLWEGTNTTASEEDQKEEVLSVFRELARESRSEGEVREYVPLQPLW